MAEKHEAILKQFAAIKAALPKKVDGIPDKSCPDDKVKAAVASGGSTEVWIVNRNTFALGVGPQRKPHRVAGRGYGPIHSESVHQLLMREKRDFKQPIWVKLVEKSLGELGAFRWVGIWSPISYTAPKATGTARSRTGPELFQPGQMTARLLVYDLTDASLLCHFQVQAKSSKTLKGREHSTVVLLKDLDRNARKAASTALGKHSQVLKIP